ncbi:MAG: 50S ribosomal protein L32e [Candidatus Micrarchaeota archaeon]|nr:MAG: 50S ribosomal protein L32e [Candidatus Micrarchaeota archaeon]
MQIKKHKPKFNVPNYGAKHRKRVKDRWRKQRGVDNKKRIKKAFMGAEPNIGYGTPKEYKNTRDGKKLIVVHNKNELESLINEADKYIIYFASSLSKKKREELYKIAAEHNAYIANYKPLK